MSDGADPPGLVNLRDLGGLPVLGGGTTRHGVLYRSDAPYDGDSVPEHVAVWPPARVVDLRMTREAERAPYDWGAATVVCPHPLHAAAAPQDVRQADLAALYHFILDEVPDRVASAVDLVVAEAVEGPTLVHCAAGKDRTGIVVAAVLLASDVEPEAVVADYVATTENLAGVVRRLAERGHHPANPAWLEAPEPAIREVVERLHGSVAGGARSWLADHGASAEHLTAWADRFVAR